MIGNLIHLMFKGISIIRWNNYPRIQDFVEAEHISLKLNISYIIANLMKENWEKVDILYIYRHLFWSSFFTFVYSDINHDLKKTLKEKRLDIYKKLWKQLWDFVFSSDIDQKIKDDFFLVVNEYVNWEKYSHVNKVEKDIMQLAKSIERKLEIKDSVHFYSLSYWNILESTKKEIDKYAKEIWFVNMDILKIYISNLLRLKFAYRWNRDNRTYPVSVLSHLFFVFGFSYFIGLLKWYDRENMEKILSISLLHDFPETITGDVITPTKESVMGFRDFLENVEEDVVHEQLLQYFEWLDFHENLKNYILYPFDSEIWAIAKCSDNLSAMFEAKIENNEKNFLVYKTIKNKLWHFNDPEIDYILKFWADYFEEDIEEKWKKFINID